MKRWLLVIWVLSCLQGCSSLKLGYQQLPTLGYWWLDSAVSFSDSQSLRTKDALQNTYRWHRYQDRAVCLLCAVGIVLVAIGVIR